MEVNGVEPEIFQHCIFRFHFYFAGGTRDVDVGRFDRQIQRARAGKDAVAQRFVRRGGFCKVAKIDSEAHVF